MPNIVNNPGSISSQLEDQRRRGGGQAVSNNRGFVVDGSGVARPGQDLEVRGLNDFVSSQNRTQTSLDRVNQTVNQAGRASVVGASRERADASFDVAEGVIARRQKGLGLNQSSRQKKAQKRTLNLGREVAKADADAGVRRGFSDRAREAARSASGFEDNLRDIETAGHTSLSNAAGQEKIRAEREAAEKKKAKNAMIGQVVGMGLSLLMLSDENAKHSKRDIRVEGSLLDKLKNVRVDKWKYNGEDRDHIGPYAQEFNDTFGVGEGHKKMISLVDAVGVTMGAIKELNEKVEANG